jgi:hypothetical protein
MSAGGHTANQGLYLNTMRYQFSNPLSMYLQVGFQHQPFGNLTGNELAGQGNQVFVSGAGVRYEPSSKLRLQVEFSQVPNTYFSPYRYNSFGSFYNRMGYRRSPFDDDHFSNQED